MNEFVRIDAALSRAVKELSIVSDSPRLDAEILLARALDVPRSYLFAHPEDELDPAASQRFFTAIDQRADGMPLAYITGEKEFWSMTLLVNPDTLVPRPETEILVEQVLRQVARKSSASILDMGTGSGAIALALAKERPLCNIVATDVNRSALNTAIENSRIQELPGITFLHGDWFEPVAEQKFDIIVSNPPYISSDDLHLERLTHEPHGALVSGNDGLDAIRHIGAHAAEFMKEGGHLFVEHGETQMESVASILAEHNWSQINCSKDLAGRPRVTSATV